MNRRELLSSLAGLPLVGFLFSTVKAEPKGLQSLETEVHKLTESSGNGFTESNVKFFNEYGTRIPSLLIPQADGGTLCIPITNCTIHFWDKINLGGPTPVNILSIKDSKIVEEYSCYWNTFVWANKSATS